MQKTILLLMVLSFSALVRAECSPGQMEMECVYETLTISLRSYIAEGDFVKAEEVSGTMLEMEPSDSWARIYLLVSLVEQDKEIPGWLREDSWPDYEEDLVILEKIGHAIARNN
jgi:hypothetical protein